MASSKHSFRALKRPHGFPMHNTHRLCSNPRVRERSWLDRSLQGAAARAMNKLTLGKKWSGQNQLDRLLRLCIHTYIPERMQSLYMLRLAPIIGDGKCTQYNGCMDIPCNTTLSFHQFLGPQPLKIEHLGTQSYLSSLLCCRAALETPPL